MAKTKKVSGYPDYTISDTGEVISYKRINRRKLKPYVAGNGYWEVTLSPERGVYKRLGLHRLIAEHFIPNPKKLAHVNHKDSDTLNFSLDNLEWVTASQNVLHYIYGRHCRHPKIKRITVDGTEFLSLKRCADHFQISAKNLSSQLAKGIIPRKLRGKKLIYKQ